MLQPAHVGHLAMLRSLIRQGAQDGSFDRELGATSPEAEAFFAKLKRALVTGYFVEEGRSGKIDTIAVPGYVFWPDDRTAGPSRSASASSGRSTAATNCGSPGSISARAAAVMAARCWRRCSRPRKAKRRTIVRVQRGSRYVEALQHLLADFGFMPVGDTLRLRWFLRTDAPADLASRVRDAVEARIALN